MERGVVAGPDFGRRSSDGYKRVMEPRSLGCPETVSSSGEDSIPWGWVGNSGPTSRCGFHLLLILRMPEPWPLSEEGAP